MPGSRLLPRSEATAAGSKVQISEVQTLINQNATHFGQLWVCLKNPKRSRFKNILFHGEHDDNHHLGHGVLHFKNPTGHLMLNWTCELKISATWRCWIVPSLEFTEGPPAHQNISGQIKQKCSNPIEGLPSCGESVPLPCLTADHIKCDKCNAKPCASCAEIGGLKWISLKMGYP